jgi:8-oxo-dGTP pyrophosphatase MutT (NUDIX family)
MKYRKKIIIIPYIVYKKKSHLMMVKDKKFNEWTFVTGGCKLNEQFNLCALRELYEETNGVLDLRNHVNIDINKFYSYRFIHEISKDFVIMDYKVFFVPLHRFGYDIKSAKTLEKKFYKISNDLPEFNETTCLKFFELSKVYTIKNIWKLIKEKVLHDERFEYYKNNVFIDSLVI